jgi:hypothetical protein
LRLVSFTSTKFRIGALPKKMPTIEPTLIATSRPAAPEAARRPSSNFGERFSSLVYALPFKSESVANPEVVATGLPDRVSAW